MPLITVKQAAERRGTSVVAIHDLIKRGRLKSQKFGVMHMIDAGELARLKRRKGGRPRKPTPPEA